MDSKPTNRLRSENTSTFDETRTFRKKVWSTLDVRYSERKGLSFVFNISLSILIFLNTIAIVLNTIPDLSETYHHLFRDFEYFSVAVFSVEYLMRLWSCVERRGHRHPVWGRLEFLFSFWGIVDLNYEGLRYVVGGIGSISKSTSRGTVRVFQFDQIMGNVILDENYTCKYDAYNELFVGGATLLIQPGDIKVTTDSNGYWSANSLTNGTYIISLDTSHYSDCKRLDTFQIVDEIKFLNLPTQYLQREKKNKIIGRFFLDDQFPFCSQNTSELLEVTMALTLQWKTRRLSSQTENMKLGESKMLVSPN